LQWEDRNGWRLDAESRRLHLLGLGALKVHLHRPIRGTPKGITVKREGRRWWVTIRCVDVPAEPLPSTGRQVGIDLGITCLVATSDGDLIPKERHGQRAATRLARAQRALATKQRGSKRRRRAVERVAAAHRHIRNRRSDTLHKLSRRLVDDHDLIVHEQLPISNLVRRPKPRPDGAGGYEPNRATAKSVLNRCIHDAGWGRLLAMITYKAGSAGRTVISVDPRNTSRTCTQCGHVSAGNRRGAVFKCLACGHEAHADTNAAINILRAGRAQQANTRCAGRNWPTTPTRRWCG
jgi:putative transposase